MAPRTAPRTAPERLRALYLHLGLWTLQSWLAMFFAGAAYGKLTQSHELLTLLLHWPDAVGLEVVRVMGAVELVLALGVLTPLISWRGGGRVMGLSAVGMLGLAAFAFALHLSRLELGFAWLNLVLAAFAMVVLVGRLRDSRVSL